MRFAEAEQEYYKLEGKLLNGELTEQEFVAQVNQLKVADAEGRRWMLSARTGRWLVHDGQQWALAEPPELGTATQVAIGAEMEFGEASIPAEAVSVPQPALREDVVAGAEPIAAAAESGDETKTHPVQRTAGHSLTRRPFVLGLLTFAILACLIGGSVSAWVFVLRDLGEPTPALEQETEVSLAITYTPRPATPTYTPTPTPTPSRAPTPTDTTVPTPTPLPSPTATMPSPSPTSATLATEVRTATPVTSTRTPTPTVVTPTPVPPVTYVVQRGDTLFEIALRFDVTVAALARANDIADPTLILPGQVLIIPVPGATVVASTESTPTWTPTVVSTPATSTATATPTPTGPTPTPTPTRTLAPTPTPTPPAALSGKIAFAVWNIYENRYDLYISNVDGSGRNLLGEGFRQPSLRQDGAMLAANGEGAPEFEHLVRMNAGGGELIEISIYVEDGLPSWSPTGDVVAFSSTAHVDRESRLGIVYDIYGRQQEWIAVSTTEVRGEDPFWMPDGQIVYHGCDFLVDHAACGLFVVPSAGGAYRRLTTDSTDTSPAGYGSRVAFMSNRDGNWEIYSVNMDGSGLKRLTNNSANDGLPTWSPDGRSIAFVSSRGGAWAIWVMDASGDNQRKLFDLGGGYGSGSSDWIFEQISWSP